MNRALGLSLSVLVLLLLGFMISCVYTVTQTQQVALVEFGAPVGVVTQPGLHFKSPLQKAYFFDRRLLELDAPKEEITTLDRRQVTLNVFARWRIVNPLVYSAQQDSNIAADNLKSILSSNLRGVLATQTLAALSSERRSALMAKIRDRMNADARQFGVLVVDVRIRRLDLPSDASDVIYQRMKKDLERQVAKSRAEGDAAAQAIRAKADHEVTVIRAEATAKAAVIRGEGDAIRIQKTAAAANQDPAFYAFWRTMQAWQETLGPNTTVILSPKSEFLKYMGEGPGSAGRRK
jgi:modulator of FtsH protease HflC